MRKLKYSAAALVASLVAVFALSGAALALTNSRVLGGDGAGSCPQGNFCLWKDANYHQGTSATTKIRSLAAWGTVSDMGKLGSKAEGSGFYPTMQDVVSSMVNNTGGTLCFYSENSFGGAVFQIHGWERWPSVPSWINDKISSFRFC